MTAITTTSADLVEARPTTKRTRSAALRRGFFVASPILAGVLLLVATIADPGAGSTGQEMNQAYTDNPGALQWHSLILHWSYAFWGVTAFMAAAYVKGRGSVLANIGAFLGFVAMTTLPGILAVDWYDSSIGQVYGVDAIASLHDHMDADPVGAAVLRRARASSACCCACPSRPPRCGAVGSCAGGPSRPPSPAPPPSSAVASRSGASR